MEQLAAEEGMTLLLMDGDQFRGGRRELNDCILCTALYDSFFCIRMGKEEREGLLQDLTHCFTFFGMIRDADRPLTERTEAAVLTSLGGIIGTITGIALAEVIGKISNVPIAISIPAVILAIAFSTIIGVVFGLLPAVKAANLDPIVALRHE